MSEPSPTPKLVHAYERMMERVKTLLENFEQAEQETLPRLQQSIEHAAEKAVELGELTRDEARQVGYYLKRDLQDAGHHLADSGHDLSAWLRFDLELIEDRMLDFLSSAADQTRLEMLTFAESVERATHYYQGEITGPGTLQCDQCAERLAFYKTSLIPACPRCGATTFSRVADDGPDKED
ncbi:MAG: zinc ribbon-containing protein [Gammaproteobacteria bacterium]|nr:zinc ribbon-containing protein [Gammaproteobacteria bacterium]MCP5425474.1 zinc ribbon-containing protein [Gammaproteobacteria bacterium]MCP5459923.1 zinc ribbon-containing protein [Gammaproteobacteria bacterium]